MSRTSFLHEARIGLVSAGLVLVSLAADARAQCPNCAFPALIRLVGENAVGVPDPAGMFTVTVRDGVGNLVPGSVVTIDVDGCGEMNLCPACCGAVCAPPPPQRAVAVTNAVGVATFDLVGARTPGVVALRNCVVIRIDGAVGAFRSVAAFDLNGIGGVNAIDLGILGADLAGGLNLPRSDYNGDGSVNAIDTGLWAAILNGGASAFGCPAAWCAP